MERSLVSNGSFGFDLSLSFGRPFIQYFSFTYFFITVIK